jgi:hypothetical protein
VTWEASVPLKKQRVECKPRKFSVETLQTEEQDRWTRAFEMYQLRFFSSSEFLDDIKRDELAKDVIKRYALGPGQKVETRHLAAVRPLYLHASDFVGASTFIQQDE